MPANIEITLNGLLVIFVSRDKQTCTVGLLRQTPPHHALKVTVLKANASGAFEQFAEIAERDVNEALQLNVSDTSTSGITQRKSGIAIDRPNGPSIADRDSFRWVVDFETELHKIPVGALKSGFRPILTLNNGELLTRTISRNKLITRLGPNGNPEERGFVACEAGIDITLDRPNSAAKFTNGKQLVFTCDPQSRFIIRIDRGQMHPHAGANDADYYYTALGSHLPPAERFFFSSTPLPPNPLPGTPDAVCLNVFASQSEPRG